MQDTNKIQILRYKRQTNFKKQLPTCDCSSCHQKVLVAPITSKYKLPQNTKLQITYTVCIILEVTYFRYKNEVSIRRNSFCLSVSELCYYRIRAIFLRENPFLEKLFVSFLLKKEKKIYVYWSICLACCGVVRNLTVLSTLIFTFFRKDQRFFVLTKKQPRISDCSLYLACRVLRGILGFVYLVSCLPRTPRMPRPTWYDVVRRGNLRLACILRFMMICLH